MLDKIRTLFYNVGTHRRKGGVQYAKQKNESIN